MPNGTPQTARVILRPIFGPTAFRLRLLRLPDHALPGPVSGNVASLGALDPKAFVQVDPITPNGPNARLACANEPSQTIGNSEAATASPHHWHDSEHYESAICDLLFAIALKARAPTWAVAALGAMRQIRRRGSRYDSPSHTEAEAHPDSCRLVQRIPAGTASDCQK